MSDAPNSNKFSSHISFRTGIRSSWFDSGLAEVSCSNSCHVGNYVGISIGEVSFANYDFTGIISGSHEPEIVMKLLHQPCEVAHPSGNVLVDTAPVSYPESLSG